MLSLEVKINSELIGHAYVENQQIICEEGSLYKVHYYMPGREPNMIKFDLVHNPDDGVEKLIFLIYQEINKNIDKAKSLKKNK